MNQPDTHLEHQPGQPVEPDATLPASSSGKAVPAAEPHRAIRSILTETEQIYQTLVENSLQGLAIIQGGRFLFANAALAGIFGYSADEIVAWSPEAIAGLLHPEDKEPVMKNITGQDLIPHLETRYIHKSGEIHWVESYASPIEYLGKPAIQVAYLDITPRKQSERALHESRERFRKIYDNAVAGIAISDQAGQLVQCNPAFCKLLGYTEEELIHQHFLTLVHPDDRAANQVEYDQMMAGQQPYFELENRYLHKDGHSIWVRKFNSVLRDVSGALTNVMALVVDISIRKAAETALGKSESRLNGIISTAMDAIITTDANQRIILFNAAAEKMTGYNAGQAMGQPLSMLLPERSRQAHTRFVEHFGQTGITAQVMGQPRELYGRRADGTEFPIEAMISQVEVAGQKYFTAIVRDISERKRIEQERDRLLAETVAQREQLRALAEKLTTTQEAERKALARELHDQVGQQLTSLNLNLTVLRAHYLADNPSPSQPLLSVVDHSLALVEETIERIQDVMANLRSPVLDDYGLLAALNWYVSKLAPQVNFTTQVLGQEPDPRLAALVELALFRIAQEALTNIIKHSRAKTVTINLQSDDLVQLTITDDGVGFVVNSQQQVAERTGLGLLTISERIEAVGGVCHVESQPGAGTRIIARVPR